jgi:hypothetical protein
MNEGEIVKKFHRERLKPILLEGSIIFMTYLEAKSFIHKD